jgi:AraC-like DNA-binding protein
VAPLSPMSIDASTPREIIGYRRSVALPGLEVLDAYHSPREWRCVGVGFAVTVVRTWRGSVIYRGRKHAVEPGIVFCNQPGEALVASPEPGQQGSFNVLVVDPELLGEWLSELQPASARPRWRSITRPISEELSARFRQVLDTFEPAASALLAQSKTTELSELLIRELISGATDAVLNDGPPIRGTARMRECLNEEGIDVDLTTLAERAGLSRFQALRAFKRRYGLPPHAYQMCLRISRACRMLRSGAATADVALACGFADQSHLNRHFKRIVGVPAGQYAQPRWKTAPRLAPALPDDIAQRSDWRWSR